MLGKQAPSPLEEEEEEEEEEEREEREEGSIHFTLYVSPSHRIASPRATSREKENP